MKIQLRTIYKSFNYGANLQAIATIEILKKIGQVSLAFPQPRKVAKESGTLRLHSWSRLVADILLVVSRFKKKYYLRNIFKPYQRLKTRDAFDWIVIGSDQVWNPEILDFDNDEIEIFLPTRVSGTRYMSVASSIGNPKPEYFKNDLVTERLKDYEFVSVRENSLALALAERGVSAVHINDPTFLLNADEWRKKFDPSEIGYVPRNKKYVLIYSVKKLDNLYKSVNKYIRENSDVEFIEITNSISSKIRGAKKLRHITLGHFIALFDNADAVITDSFHGTAFSIYFSKDFITFTTKDSDARAYSFLVQFDLAGRLFYDETDLTQHLKTNIDYKPVVQKLSNLRLQSIQKIHSQLS